jgi:hypothetical protein
MQGAPTISGTAGAGITFFDAVLVNGFGQLTLTSLSVTSAVATATISAGHAYKQWSVVEIAGATPTELNGRKRVLSVTATELTFGATGVSDGSATGTITCKIPGAGWTKPYTGTNLAAYRLNSTTGTGSYLRVDDTGTTEMRVVGYSAMTDINTGTDPFPTSVQVSGGGFMRKSSLSTTTARGWTMLADDRGFYLNVRVDGISEYKAYWFGDFNSFSTGTTTWECALACGIVTGSSGSSFLGVCNGATTTMVLYIPRAISGVAGALRGSKIGLAQVSAPTSVAYPCPVVGGIVASRGILIQEGATANSSYRGEMPGYAVFMNNCASVLVTTTPILLDGFDEYILPLTTGDSTSLGLWFGVNLGDWR